MQICVECLTAIGQVKSVEDLSSLESNGHHAYQVSVELSGRLASMCHTSGANTIFRGIHALYC